MRKRVFKILFTLFALLLSCDFAKAVHFDVVVLPTDLYNVCDNYFCFPEASEIAANNVIFQLNSYKNISAHHLDEVRSKLNQNNTLKEQTIAMLKAYRNSERIDYQALNNLSKEFNVKSILIISSNVTNPETQLKRQLWDILELTSAFKISHPFTLNTSAVLIDTVNNTVMLSHKYAKNISNNEGYFIANNQAQAYSQVEKIKLYYKDNVSRNLAQNIKLRFFPKDVRTFTPAKSQENNIPTFVPNALEKLTQPTLRNQMNGINYENSVDDFIFEF